MHTTVILPALLLSALVLPLQEQEGAAPPSAEPDGPTRVAIVVFPGVELLDFAGPGEVFSVATDRSGNEFETFTVATTKERLTSQGFVHVTPQYDLEDCPKPDIVVVPGGSVPLHDEALRAWLTAQRESAELMMSVCNGASLYGSLGFFDGLDVTTHHSNFHRLAALAPTARVVTNRRFVDHGHVMTCAGVSAGIDGALHVVARMCGEEEARSIAAYMEYEWRPEEIAALHEQPARTLDDMPEAVLAARVRSEGLEAVVAALRAEPEAPSEDGLNRAAYGLLRADRTEDALALMKLVCALHPESPNAKDSLAEVLEREGHGEEALALSRKGLELLPGAEGLGDERRALIANALGSRVARLTGDTERLRYVCPPCGHACCELRYLEPTRCPGCSMQLVEADD